VCSFASAPAAATGSRRRPPPMLERTEASKARRRAGPIGDRQYSMIGDVQHKQLEVAGSVLLVDLVAEARGRTRPLCERALQFAAQAEQAEPAGKADVDDALVLVCQ